MTQQDDQRKGIVQQSTDHRSRIIAPVGGQRGVTQSYVCPHCHRFPIEDYVWWVSTRHGEEQCNWWCAACGGQYTWRNPNGVLVLQDSTDRREAKVCRAHALPQAIGEPAVGRGMTTLCRCLLRVFQIDELQRLIKVDDHEEVNIADLEKYSVALHVVEPKFGREDFPEAAVREGVGELTLRRGEAVGLRTFIDTTNVGD